MTWHWSVLNTVIYFLNAGGLNMYRPGVKVFSLQWVWVVAMTSWPSFVEMVLYDQYAKVNGTVWMTLHKGHCKWYAVWKNHIMPYSKEYQRGENGSFLFLFVCNVECLCRMYENITVLKNISFPVLWTPITVQCFT